MADNESIVTPDGEIAVDSYLLKAERLLEEGRVSAACNEYLLYASQCIKNGDISEAIRYYSKIEDHKLLKSDGRHQLAEMLIGTGNKSKAANIYISIASGQEAQGLSEEAVGTYKIAIEKIPEKTELQHSLAELYISLDQSQKALNIYSELLENSPNEIKALHTIAELYRKRNSKTEAIDAYLRIAKHYEREGDIKSVAKAYERIYEVSPEGGAALKKLTEIYVKLGDKARLVETMLNMAHWLLSQNEKEKALNLYYKVQQLEPQNEEAQRRLGDFIQVISVLPDDDLEAAPDFDFESGAVLPEIDVGDIKGTPIDPDAPMNTINDLLGFELPQKKEEDPVDGQVYYDLGIAYLEMGLFDEAIQYLQTSSRSPDFRLRSCNMLGLCFLDRGMPEMAVIQFERALKIAGISEDSAIGLHYNLAQAYERAQDFERALQELNEVYAVNVNYLDVKERLDKIRRIVAGK